MEKMKKTAVFSQKLKNLKENYNQFNSVKKSKKISRKILKKNLIQNYTQKKFSDP